MSKSKQHWCAVYHEGNIHISAAAQPVFFHCVLFYSLIAKLAFADG